MPETSAAAPTVDRPLAPAVGSAVKVFCLSALALMMVRYAVAPYSFSPAGLLREVLYPVLLVIPLCHVLAALTPPRSIPAAIIPYAMFFSISVLSALHLVNPINGAFSSSTVLLVYGLPFYTATIAVWSKRGELSGLSPFLACNPLLLITGPIPVRFFYQSSSVARRLKYFGPYMIVGFFFFKVVASPLAYCQTLVELTDPLNALIFAVIFELFVYFNFAGLSLLVFGALGILGLKVPLNFRQPFSSRNLVDFWKGWHTSLSAVLKCLFYTPTKARLGTNAAVLTVFCASAAWHGMTWNFVIWGLLHGIGYILTLVFLRSGWRILSVLLLGVTIVFGRLVFADTDITRLIEKLSFRFENPDFAILTSGPKTFYISLVLALVLVAVEFAFHRNRFIGRRTYKHLRAWGPLTVITVLLVMLAENTGLDYAVYGQR